MKVLIAGASGLIGGRLLAALEGDGKMQVRAMSRVARAWPPGVEGFALGSDPTHVLSAACEGIDVVVNLASMSESACAADPAGALHANVGGTLNLMRAAVSANSGRFVQLSTSKVYGSDLSGMVSEETIPHPTSHYAITHRAAEDYAACHRFAVVLRLANGFGAPATENAQSWNIIVNDFCRQAATDHSISIRSDGSVWRNFVPLSDVMVALGAARTWLPAGTYNLGSAKSMTLRAMADRVATVASEVLGVAVDVRVGASIPATRRTALDYRTDKLRAAGVSLDGLIDDEIRSTIAAACDAFV